MTKPKKQIKERAIRTSITTKYHAQECTLDD
jgi:hypothetical protein